jgi:hypothetical protein
MRDKIFTETDWQTSNSLADLRDFLWSRTTARKRLLFGCAVCRHLHANFLRAIATLMAAVEVVERFADELATDDEYTAALSSIRYPPEFASLSLYPKPALNERPMLEDQMKVDRWFYNPWGHSYDITFLKGDVGKAVVPVLREVFNPFRCTTVLVEWQKYRDSILALASSAYEERTFDVLPILADLLEEAGCEDASILDHCRGLGPHFRGCWVIDLLLGKS